MGRDKKRRLPLTEDFSTGKDVFAEAAASMGFDITEETTHPSDEKPDANDTVVLSEVLRGKNVGLRIERKGRRGKTVTVVEGLHADESVLRSVAREMRRALGCGSSVDGDALILQGDNRERAGRWLSERGVRVRG